MKLVDRETLNSLETTSWSKTEPVFGIDNQLKVIGKIPKSEHYVLSCSVCTEDSELYGEGLFRATKAKLLSGQVPCGCSKSPTWEQHQLHTLAGRVCDSLGIEFVGTLPPFRGLNSKAKLCCDEHGSWESTTLNSLLYNRVGCPKCSYKERGLLSLKSETSYKTSFEQSGNFHPNTTFKRLDERYKWDGNFWEVVCGECTIITKVSTRSLQKGRKYCPCGSIAQRQAYINLVIDSGTPIAVKFGIARDSAQRLKGLNRGSVYNLVTHAIYVFPDNISCTEAERKCRDTFICGILPRNEIESGFTETTYVANVAGIHRIYAEFGGVRIDDN